MKNTIVKIIALFVLAMFLNMNPAFAGNRVKVYEMAESGISVEFPAVTPDKAVADAITEKIISEDLKI